MSASTQVWTEPTFKQCGDFTCYAVSAGERVRTWEAEHGPIPVGMRVAQTCLVPYCWKLEHMELAINKNHGHQRVAPYVNRLREMQPGEYFDIPKPASMDRFRTAFTQLCCDMVCAIRTAADGHNIRLVRLGSWWQREAANEMAKKFPVVFHWSRFNSKPWQKPHSIWMGQFILSPEDEAFLALPRRRTCSVKACPFPSAEQGKCRYHARYFEFKWSMEWRALGYPDVYPTEDVPTPLLSTMWRGQEPHSAEHTVFQYKGQFDRGAKLSADWWRENVEKYAAQLPQPEVHVRFTREASPQYAPETKIANEQHTGAFILWKGFGKKKIRKSQRMRPQGWHGNHPEQKPRERFTRETIDEVPMWAPQSRQEETEPELYMDDDMGYVPLEIEESQELAEETN